MRRLTRAGVVVVAVLTCALVNARLLDAQPFVREEEASSDALAGVLGELISLHPSFRGIRGATQEEVAGEPHAAVTTALPNAQECRMGGSTRQPAVTCRLAPVRTLAEARRQFADMVAIAAEAIPGGWNADRNSSSLGSSAARWMARESDNFGPSVIVLLSTSSSFSNLVRIERPYRVSIVISAAWTE